MHKVHGHNVNAVIIARYVILIASITVRQSVHLHWDYKLKEYHKSKVQLIGPFIGL